MALISWEPPEGFGTLRRDVDRLIEDFLGKGILRGGDRGTTEPAVEVFETKDTVVIRAQVPGVEKANLQVNITDDALVLKGETKQEEEKEERDYHLREFRYGTFSRHIPLPASVQPDRASASLKDGVLEVKISKSEEAKVREIPIQA